MHSSTAFVTLVLLAAAAPSLSLPVYTRDTDLVFARHAPVAPAASGAADQQSGAFSLGKIFKGAAHAIFGREDAGELLSREDFEDILARAVPAAAPAPGSPDQSGAFSFGKLLKGAARLIFREDGEMLSRREIEDVLARDDFEELLARAVPTTPAAPGSPDQSGAFSFGKLLKGAARLIFREDGEMLSRREIEDVLARDDFEELLARAVPATPAPGSPDQSGAFSFGKLLKGAARLIFREDGEMLSRREIEDIMARDDFEELVARAVAPPAAAGADQQSGAFSFGKLLKGAARLIFRSEDELMTRDFDEFFARDDSLVARDEDLVARDDELFSREDFEDLLARAAPAPADQSGAFNLGKIIKGAAHLIFRDDSEMLSRREIEDVLAREAPADQSGAFSFGKLIKGAAHAIFGREEGELMARDLFDEELFARDDELMARDFYDFEDVFARDVPEVPTPAPEFPTAGHAHTHSHAHAHTHAHSHSHAHAQSGALNDAAVAPVHAHAHAHSHAHTHAHAQAPAPAGAPNDQSGGLFLGKIIKGVGHALFGREEDLYARDDIYDFEARSLNELD